MMHVLQNLEYVHQSVSGGERLSEGAGRGQGVRVRGRWRRGEVQRSRWKSGGAGRSEGADFCKFAGTVNRYGGSCGRLVEAFGNS